MTTADTAAERPGAAREGLLARHPLLFFFIIAYAVAWLVAVPVALSEETGTGLLPFRSPIGLYTTIAIASLVGPFLAAFIMTGITEGRIGMRRFLLQFVLWRVGLRWYLFALVGIPVILGLTAIVLPGGLASFQGQGLASLAPLPLLSLFVWIFFLGGPFGEEPGWRGFALPRLQRLHGPLVGSLILGPLWGVWHLPIFLIPEWNLPPTLLNIVLFVFGITCGSIVFTWVFNNTKGSVFMAVLVHASIDFSLGLLTVPFPAPLVTDYGGNVPLLVGFGALALAIIVFTRGRLGYEHYLREAEGEPDPATARW